MKKTKHWLHILLSILTGGLWLFPYLLVVATNEMFNRGHREGKQAGRVERQNEIDEERQKPKFAWQSEPDPRTMPNCRCVAVPIYPEGTTVRDDSPIVTGDNGKQSRLDRFEYLNNKRFAYGLSSDEITEFNHLREALING